MGITFVSSDQLLARYANEIRKQDGVTYEIFKIMVKDLANQFKKQEGRYFVLLSLEEAEHFRGVIHGRKGTTLLSSEAKAGTLTAGNSYSHKYLQSSYLCLSISFTVFLCLLLSYISMLVIT